MAYNFVAASSQYLTATVGPAQLVQPLTLFARFNTAEYTNTQSVVSNNHQTTNTLYNRTALYGTSTYAGLVIAMASGSGGTAYTPNDSWSANIWQAISGVFTNDNFREVMIDGDPATRNHDTTAQTNSSWTLLGIGARKTTSWGSFMNGNLAEVAVWEVSLTDAELRSLGKGFKPTRIRPQSLIFYAPLIRNLQDLRYGVTITNNNTATVATTAHPRVY